MRVIDANELYRVKFHGYPDIEITPSDVNAEAYKRGWNDAIDAVAECAPVVEVVRCRDCVYGEQDEVGRWFCNDLGCQIGNEDGSGYCADGERRETNEGD